MDAERRTSEGLDRGLPSRALMMLTTLLIAGASGACSNDVPPAQPAGQPRAGSAAPSGAGGAGSAAGPAAGSGAEPAGPGASPSAGSAGGVGSAGSSGGRAPGATDEGEAMHEDAGSGGPAREPAAPGPGGMTASGYMNLAVGLGMPLTAEEAQTPATPPPAGWQWYPIAGTFCRDGTPNGIYLRTNDDSDKLLIYFEGGGACTTKGFCHFNPPNVDSVLTGDGQTVLGTALAAGPGRQQPGTYNLGALDGIFSPDNPANPFNGWNMVYIPYCTGDVHFGSNAAGMVLNVPEPQKFVGYRNTREFMSRVVPTFNAKVDRVVVTGASAGSFGAALNFSMISDSFGPDIRVDAVLDSGVPFKDEQWPACLQDTWRKLWGMNDSLPPDCATCFNEDGGGLVGLADFLIDKHPTGDIAAISSLHDEVIRLFFTPGEQNCSMVTTADPFEITLGQIAGLMLFPPDKYEAGLLGLRTGYEHTGRLSTYYFGGELDIMHQHTFRARFFEPIAGGKSMAQFLTEFLAGTMQQVGP